MKMKSHLVSLVKQKTLPVKKLKHITMKRLLKSREELQNGCLLGMMFKVHGFDTCWNFLKSTFKKEEFVKVYHNRIALNEIAKAGQLEKCFNDLKMEKKEIVTSNALYWLCFNNKYSDLKVFFEQMEFSREDYLKPFENTADSPLNQLYCKNEHSNLEKFMKKFYAGDYIVDEKLDVLLKQNLSNGKIPPLAKVLHQQKRLTMDRLECLLPEERKNKFSWIDKALFESIMQLKGDITKEQLTYLLKLLVKALDYALRNYADLGYLELAAPCYSALLTLTIDGKEQSSFWIEYISSLFNQEFQEPNHVTSCVLQLLLDGAASNSLDLCGKDTRLNHMMGDTYVRKNKYKEALFHYYKVLIQDGKNTDVWQKKAYIFQVLGKYEKARKCYQWVPKTKENEYIQSLLPVKNPNSETTEEKALKEEMNGVTEVTQQFGKMNSKPLNHSTISLRKFKERLFVGEGNFSFTEAYLGNQMKKKIGFSGECITATEYLPKEDLQMAFGSGFKTRIERLKKKGVKVLFKVDATKLHDSNSTKLDKERVKRIHFVCPYKGKALYLTKGLVEEFFKSASLVQIPGDQILVVMPLNEKDGSGNRYWRQTTIYGIYDAAANAGYRLVKKRAFVKDGQNRYPDYNHEVTLGNGDVGSIKKNLREYIFEKTTFAFEEIFIDTPPYEYGKKNALLDCDTDLESSDGLDSSDLGFLSDEKTDLAEQQPKVEVPDYLQGWFDYIDPRSQFEYIMSKVLEKSDKLFIQVRMPADGNSALHAVLYAYNKTFKERSEYDYISLRAELGQRLRAVYQDLLLLEMEQTQIQKGFKDFSIEKAFPDHKFIDGCIDLPPDQKKKIFKDLHHVLNRKENIFNEKVWLELSEINVLCDILKVNITISHIDGEKIDELVGFFGKYNTTIHIAFTSCTGKKPKNHYNALSSYNGYTYKRRIDIYTERYNFRQLKLSAKPAKQEES